MSDDDTRELPPVAAAEEDPREAAPETAGEVAAVQGAGAATGTTEEDETVRIERATPEPARAEGETVPLPRAEGETVPLPRIDDATAPLPTTQVPSTPPPAPAGQPADAYAAGHIRVMAPAAAPVAPAPEPARTLRVGTVVWGLVVAAVGVGLMSVSWGAHLDTELAFIVLLGAAGVALLVGSLVGMRRSRRRLEGRS